MNQKKQKKIQERFEQMYQNNEKPWRQHKNEPLLNNFFALVKEKYNKAKILDLGCGDGWISITAAKRGHETWGLDSSKTSIKEARESAEKEELKNVHFQVGDALNLPYQSDFFEVLIDRGLFHHILPENRPHYFDNIHKVLKPESLLYLSVFSDRNERDTGQTFTKELVNELFGPHFSEVSFKEDPYPYQSPSHLLHFIFEKR